MGNGSFLNNVFELVWERVLPFYIANDIRKFIYMVQPLFLTLPHKDRLIWENFYKISNNLKNLSV